MSATTTTTTAAKPVYESGASAEHSNLLMRRADLLNLPEIPSLPEYTLREYQPSDCQSLTSLMSAAFGSGHGSWDADRVDKVFIKDASIKRVFVLEHNGEIVASATARVLPERFPESGYLHWVAVRPSYQSDGLGRLISIVVLHEFSRLGLKSAVLETQDERLAAITCYERLGFVRQMVDEGQNQRWKEIDAKIQAFRTRRTQQLQAQQAQ